MARIDSIKKGNEMARNAITETDVNIQCYRLARMLNNDKIILHMGNKSYKISNKLIIGNTNVWLDGMAGYTKRDAYNALRLMIAALAVSKTD